MSFQGIDISSYQSTVPAGLDFYIIKASEGNGWKDPKLDSHYNRCIQLSSNIGFYHYARPDLQNTPQAEAEWFLSLVGQHAGQALFALDWEGNSLNYPASWALEWLQYVEAKTGVKPLFYCSTGFVNGGKYASIAKANYGLWLAQYAPKPTLSANSGWDTYAIWQYGESVAVNGLGAYDGNVLNGDQSTWDKYAGRQTVAPTPSEPPKKEPQKELVKLPDKSIYRLYNKTTGAHYLTASFENAQSMLSNGFDYEGLAFESALSGSKPVYEMAATNLIDFIYTTDPNECKALEKMGFSNKGTAFYSEGATPIYRLYNPNSTGAGAHLFTALTSEVEGLIKAGWSLEGVPFYCLKKGDV